MRALVARTGLLVVLTGLTPGCLLEEVALSARKKIEETRPFEPGGTFRLDNTNGTVTVTTWDEPSVRIEAEKAASSERALDNIEIDIHGERDWLEVKTRYPGGRLLFGSSGKVDYNITLPRQARIELDTVNGRVRVRGIQGQVRASTVNGSVEIEDASGEVETSTVNGSITATFLLADPNGHHRFSTTNGSVALYLPSDAGGEVEARTVNGSIETDFPLEVSGRIGRHLLKGRIGDGRGSFDISTVNGSVRIREKPAWAEKPTSG